MGESREEAGRSHAQSRSMRSARAGHHHHHTKVAVLRLLGIAVDGG